MIDGVAGKLPINQAARERHIVYYQRISVSHFELVKALSHNCAVSCKQTEDLIVITQIVIRQTPIGLQRFQ